MADIRDMVEKWDGHTGNEVEKFLKQEISKKQNTLRLGAGLGWDEDKLAVKFGTGLGIQDGKLVITVSGGTTYTEGDGISISSKIIAVHYGSGLSINSSNQIYVDTSKIAGSGIDLDGDRKTLTIGTKAAQALAGTGLIPDGPLMKVNYGTGLTMSNAKLVVDPYSLLTADGGLCVDEGGRLNIMVGAGLTIADCSVAVKYGSGLSVNSSNQIYVDTSKIAGSGIDLDGDRKTLTIGTKAAQALAGTGLISDGPLMKVNYGTGLTVSNAKLVVDPYSLLTADGGLCVDEGGGLNIMVGAGLTIADCSVAVKYGSGLAIDCDNQLYSTVSDGKTYSEGDGIIITDDKINVAYDLETIVLDDCGGLSVNYGRGLEMHCGKLCAVKQDGKTYTGGDGISVDNTTNEVSFKLGTSLESVCGYIQVAISSGLEYNINDNARISVKVGKGIGICDNAVTVALGQGLVFGSGNNLDLSLQEKSGLKINSEGLGVNAGVALGTSDGKLNVQYGTGLSVNSNQIYVDTSKIAGAGMNFEDITNKLTIGTEAAKMLAGSGLKQVGPQLVVDAENLTVGDADKLAGYRLGYGNGQVPLNAPFPEFIELISMGYLRSDYESQGYPDEDFLKAICKWAIATYSGVGKILLMGSVAPSVAGVLILSLCSSSGYDATSLLPRYCSGCFMPLGGKSYKFYTYDYVWSMHEMASLDSTVAKATMADQAKYATKSDSIRFIGARYECDCVPEAPGSLQIYHAYGQGSTSTGGDDGWILAFRWENGNYLTQIYVDVDDTHIMSIRHRRADSTWTEWKRIALTDSTVARAIADGCGNNIAATYAENFTPTNGLAMNEYRTLYLPNLSASVVNGAVDNSKNGAQRVLELSCGAIEIKLSTGLGIDEKGYLYVKG